MYLKQLIITLRSNDMTENNRADPLTVTPIGTKSSRSNYKFQPQCNV